jgi:hypothetical protein
LPKSGNPYRATRINRWVKAVQEKYGLKIVEQSGATDREAHLVTEVLKFEEKR